MAKILNYKQFIHCIAEKNYRQFIKRFYELAGVEHSDLEDKDTYPIMVTFEFGNILTEHQSIYKFKKTNNKYCFHSGTTNPPVKAHYHVVSLSGKQDIYAVIVDETAHHKTSKGYQIPKKEAEELREFGVEINDDGIIEHIDCLETEQKQRLYDSLKRDNISMWIEIEV